jgi:predicted transcriptional regulator
MAETDTGNLKDAAHRLIDGLPDDATWDDLMYRVYLRQAIDAGLRDADEGRVVDVSEVRRQFGLAE